MKIGALLLGVNNFYEYNGELPDRPEWDKDWLKYLCRNADGIIYSEATEKTLPEWAKKYSDDWDLNLGIATLRDKPDLLLITRSTHQAPGKIFDLSEWERVPVEVWKRKEQC